MLAWCYARLFPTDISRLKLKYLLGEKDWIWVRCWLRYVLKSAAVVNFTL